MKIPVRWGKLIRSLEVVVVLVLGGFAWLTYHELTSLRRAPVLLPAYEFEVGKDAEGPVVKTRGTWIADRGSSGPMHTTSIECRKARMECVASSAQVALVADKGILEATHTAFGIEKWDEQVILSKPLAASACETRVLHIDFADKRARVRVIPGDDPKCGKRTEQLLELVSGYKARAPQ